MRCVVEVITTGDGLPDFLGAFCSGRVFSAPVVSHVHVISSERCEEVSSYHCFGWQLAGGGFGDSYSRLLACLLLSSE
jgi:hypothetical protein